MGNFNKSNKKICFLYYRNVAQSRADFKSTKPETVKTSVETLTGRREADWQWLHQFSFLQGVSRVDEPFPYSWRVQAAAWQHQHGSVTLFRQNSLLKTRSSVCVCSQVTSLASCTTVMSVQQQQPVDAFSAGFEDESLRQQLRIICVFQSVAAFGGSLPQNTVNHVTLHGNVLLFTSL